jgi:hypothetical protein
VNLPSVFIAAGLLMAHVVWANLEPGLNWKNSIPPVRLLEGYAVTVRLRYYLVTV